MKIRINESQFKILAENHIVFKKKSSLQNLMSSVQSLADAVRYIESSCEEIEDNKIINKLVKIKNKIMTDSGLGTGFDEHREIDIISSIQNIVNNLEKNVTNLEKKNNLSHFF